MRVQGGKKKKHIIYYQVLFLCMQCLSLHATRTRHLLLITIIIIERNTVPYYLILYVEHPSFQSFTSFLAELGGKKLVCESLLLLQAHNSSHNSYYTIASCCLIVFENSLKNAHPSIHHAQRLRFHVLLAL